MQKVLAQKEEQKTDGASRPFFCSLKYFARFVILATDVASEASLASERYGTKRIMRAFWSDT